MAQQCHTGAACVYELRSSEALGAEVTSSGMAAVGRWPYPTMGPQPWRMASKLASRRSAMLYSSCSLLISPGVSSLYTATGLESEYGGWRRSMSK